MEIQRITEEADYYKVIDIFVIYCSYNNLLSKGTDGENTK